VERRSYGCPGYPERKHGFQNGFKEVRRGLEGESPHFNCLDAREGLLVTELMATRTPPRPDSTIERVYEKVWGGRLTRGVMRQLAPLPGPSLWHVPFKLWHLPFHEMGYGNDSEQIGPFGSRRVPNEVPELQMSLKTGLSGLSTPLNKLKRDRTGSPCIVADEGTPPKAYTNRDFSGIDNKGLISRNKS
jgi:hypothetical protein